MNSIVFFAFLIADISALMIPEEVVNTVDLRNKRLVSSSVTKGIEAVSQSIKDAGLDPFNIPEKRVSAALPVPALFNIEAYVEEILSTGISNIQLYRINYNPLLFRLNFDIGLPLIEASLGAASLKTVLFSNSLDIKTSGKVQVQSIRVAGQVRLGVGVISGLSVRSIKINFTLGDITSDVKLIVQGKDFSAKANNFIGSTVPNTIKAHYPEINELLEIVLKEVIDSMLP